MNIEFSKYGSVLLMLGTGQNLPGTRAETIDRGANTFFSEKIRGAKTFFMQIFPKTRPRYPVNFDRSLKTFQTPSKSTRLKK